MGQLVKKYCNVLFVCLFVCCFKETYNAANPPLRNRSRFEKIGKCSKIVYMRN